ncbi:MAG: DNA-formamidopyrimidine glycosylase [Patescibacteria group bacterium]
MPELPEVETIRRSLQSDLPGKTIKAIEVIEQKQFKGDHRKAIGKKVIDVIRKGKMLTLVLDDSLYLTFHLMLTGQILLAADKDNAVFANVIPHTGSNKLPVNSTRVIIEFNDHSALYFNDQRKFGWVKLTETMEETKSVDVLSKDFSLEYFKKSIGASRKPIKPLLLEQDKITGIGNIYDNDALWEAKIHPTRKANSLSEVELETLHKAIKDVINEGIMYKGSSAKDEMYVLPDSTKGSYQEHFKVYHRNGQPCLRDTTLIERIELGGRGTFFCPKCQK